MLEFAQIEAGNYKVNIETMDLVMLLQNSVENFKEEASRKNLELKTQFNNKSIFVDVDINCVGNTINNLLSNAIKFTKQGFIEVEVNILEERELAVCKIKDSGIGISSAYLDHLFQPFSQEDLNIGRNYEGNGLGLALSKKYVEKMGGSLLVDSIKGVGSTFTFTLPLSQNRKKANANGIKKDLKRILMLDDSNESSELLRAFLKNEYEIEVHSLRDFKLDLIDQKDHGIIIFDVNHVHWSQSLIICKDLKKHDSLKRPLIILSNEFIEEKIREFYEAGADKFIIKPFSKNKLIKAIEEVTALELTDSI
jgi:CheY-like chemotaxis protein/two-component sensor histidine kinase